MQDFNNLIEFRQTVYDEVLTRSRDAQFELVDALLLSAPVHSFPELSRSPVFRRQWYSAYTAIEDGRQDQKKLERYLSQLLPKAGFLVFPLDTTAWPHPDARTMLDRQFVYSGSNKGLGASVVIGHPYSILAWAPKRNSSWAPPLSVRRVPSEKTDIQVGVEQVKQLCRDRQAETRRVETFHLIAADGKYGNHSFLGALKDEPCGVLARMRCDRVLCKAPGEYSGKGRPRKHGQPFAFKDPSTWDIPQAAEELEDEKWGQVRLQRWDDLHARQDASTVFSVLLVEAHREKEKPGNPLWLAYQPPPGQKPGAQAVVDLWRGYQHRWPVEPGTRFRKQSLVWTLPRFQDADACDRWTLLVTLAQWQLFLARDLIADRPLPWQQAQENPTPERVLQGLGGLFSQIPTPAREPKARGKSAGWPKGKARARKERQKVVKKTTKKGKKKR
ncbi:MAG: hypothetical protein EHM56_14980 [Chloroflexi bacterium]|nr:MAG: hypothetical protein EHM56_14980 [Chloroflexota bacterium]